VRDLGLFQASAVSFSFAMCSCSRSSLPSAHHLERVRDRLHEDTQRSTNAEICGGICQRYRARTAGVGRDRDQGGTQVSPREKCGTCVRYNACQTDCEATIELGERKGMEEGEVSAL
jgi:hypothetical protein